MPYAELSSDTTKIVTLYLGPQKVGDKGGQVVEIATTDARYVAWQAMQAAQAQYAAALLTGVQITSAATPALNGTYACNPAAQQAMSAEALYVQATTAGGAGKFTNGQTTKGWPDASGALHTFTTVQFVSLAEAIAQYLDALATALAAAQGGAAWAPPATALSIP
jgi:hypothetical protein